MATLATRFPFFGKALSAVQAMRAPSGTVINLGLIDWDGHNKRWEDRDNRFIDMRNMRRDPVIKGMLRAWTLPILNAGGRIEPASDSNEDKKISEFVEDVFFGGKTTFDFREFQKRMFRYNEFGFQVMVKRTQNIDNQIYWKRFTELNPESVEKWFTDEDFNIKSIFQENAYNSTTDRFENHHISIDSVFYIANDVQGANFEGESILAAVYGPWFRKDKLLKLRSIQAERGAVGIPRAKLPRNVDKTEIEKIKNVLSTFRSHERQYVVQTIHDAEIDFIGGKDFFGIDLNPTIESENREIVESINAGFLQQSTGDSASGSFAKQVADIDFFKMGVAAQQDFIDSVLNNGYLGSQSIIKQLVTLNFPNVTEFPKYVSNDAYQDDILLLAQAAKALKDASLLTPTNEDEEFFRDRGGFPEVELSKERPKPMVPVMGSPDDAQGDEPEEDDDDEEEELTTNKSIEFAHRKRGRQVTPELKKLEKEIEISSMREELDRKEKLAQKEMDAFVKDTRDRLVKKAELIVKKKSINEVVAAIEAFNIPNRTKMEKALSKHGKDLFLFGKARVRLERGKQAFQDILEDSNEARRTIKPTVTVTISNFYDKLRTEWSNVILSQFKSGNVDTLAIREGLERVSDRVFKLDVNRRLAEFFGMGRNTQLVAQGTEKVIRSEILDSNTCTPCVAIDGEIITIGSARWSAVSRGVFNGCLGGDLCRGINLEWVE